MANKHRRLRGQEVIRHSKQMERYGSAASDAPLFRCSEHGANGIDNALSRLPSGVRAEEAHEPAPKTKPRTAQRAPVSIEVLTAACLFTATAGFDLLEAPLFGPDDLAITNPIM